MIFFPPLLVSSPPGWGEAIPAQPSLFDVSTSDLKLLIARPAKIIFDQNNPNNLRSLLASWYLRTEPAELAEDLIIFNHHNHHNLRSAPIRLPPSGEATKAQP